MKKRTKYGLILGGVLLLLHTAAVLKVFIYAHNSNDGQAVFAYMYFLVIDVPTIWLGFMIEQHAGLLSGITDWWYNQGHQGQFKGHDLNIFLGWVTLVCHWKYCGMAFHLGISED